MWRELQSTLDGVLAGLPDHYRSALVLCYLEGRTQEAARRLGCPLATLRSRVVRELTLSVPALATALLAGSAAAAPSVALRELTLRAAVHWAAGRSPAGLVTPRVAALVDGGLRAVAAGKWVGLSALVRAAGLIAAGTVAVTGTGRPLAANPGQPKAPPAAPAEPAPKAEARTDRFGDPLPAGAVARLGGVRPLPPFQKLHPGRARNLKVLGQSEEFPPAVLVYKKDGIDEAALKTLRDGFLTAHQTAKGARLMGLIRVEKFDVVPGYEESVKKCLKAYPAPPPEK